MSVLAAITAVFLGLAEAVAAFARFERQLLLNAVRIGKTIFAKRLKKTSILQVVLSG
jgi:hypothetical protein